MDGRHGSILSRHGLNWSARDSWTLGLLVSVPLFSLCANLVDVRLAPEPPSSCIESFQMVLDEAPVACAPGQRASLVQSGNGYEYVKCSCPPLPATP